MTDAKKISDLTKQQSNVIPIDELKQKLAEANQLVDDVVLKHYLTRLSELEVLPLENPEIQINDIQLFKITEMVYQTDEYSTHKFSAVFDVLQNLNCGVFIVVDSDGEKTEFYMGVRSLDDKRTTSTLKSMLENSLKGQFPGVKTENLLNDPAEELLKRLPSEHITSVSVVAKSKDENSKDNLHFIQGLEKFALAMQGKKYTGIVLGKSVDPEELSETRNAYETIYTQLSPFANLQMSYGQNMALSVSDAFSKGSSKGTSSSFSKTKSENISTSTSKSVSKDNMASKLLGGIGAVAGVVSGVALATTGVGAPVGGAMIVAGVSGIGATLFKDTTTMGDSDSSSVGNTEGRTEGENDSVNESATKTNSVSNGTSNNLQLTIQNKTLINTLERIDTQLKRMDECESLGMWECATYFLSDSQQTAEMAAGTYNSLMRGEKTGVEVSAINSWGKDDQENHKRLKEYITNFIHPVFSYESPLATLQVTPASLVSGNEMALHMGLPRKSVTGFPVVDHAEFGKEVVCYNADDSKRSFSLGEIYSMGIEGKTRVEIELDSLTMHTFVTGSTGAGKSNTIYEILDKTEKLFNIPFLVVEPAKGEYKNAFGNRRDVAVYGTNPKKMPLLRINPFRFPADIHILEHLDRLVELFNACWPMYAAMPAILKEAMEYAYKSVGWDLETSENPNGEKYPNFADVLDKIEQVIENSRYSADSKGDYTGALMTRVRSLTNGLNGQIFTVNDLSDKALFDSKVIVDLSRVGSVETKALIMGLLVMKLNEYRMTSGKSNSPLSHITVLEEAHNLLKRTSTEQSADGANLLGKSVEMLTNSIAEMRTYGEGFIIADQSPELLDMAVIRNTNTKIILRLPAQSDRELVGKAANLNDEQIKELAKLDNGVAAVYQNNWVNPVLVKVHKATVDETSFQYSETQKVLTEQNIRNQVVKFLLHLRVGEHLDFNASKIVNNIDILRLSSVDRLYILDQIADYIENPEFGNSWDGDFSQLSRRLISILGIRGRVENNILTARDDEELTIGLLKLSSEVIPEASRNVRLALCHCMIKDFSKGKDETEVREKIYQQWIEYTRERG
ncbi:MULTISPECIES: helicase HerA domain-containing protein [Lactococcus]|uniref:helicase HerA domain-containing protein n=1 Tax=Lactococcus TaxID=1357 RepID=UPI002FC62A52